MISTGRETKTLHTKKDNLDNIKWTDQINIHENPELLFK